MTEGEFLKILDTYVKEEIKKKLQTGDVYADPSTMGTALRLDETW